MLEGSYSVWLVYVGGGSHVIYSGLYADLYGISLQRLLIQ